MTRILVVDDEPINHELVARALEHLGAQLEFAATGKSGSSQGTYYQTRRNHQRCDDA